MTSWCARARLEAGLALEVISGVEEIRLVHLAVRRRLEALPEPWIQVELGGGSVEIALADRGGVRWSETHPLGAVRLLEVLGIGSGDPRRARALVAGRIDALRVPAAVLARQPQAFVATGGNIDSLARQWGRDDGVCRSIAIDDLAAAIEELAGLTVEQRMQRFGLGADRADVILPAALVYHRLASSAGAVRILAPGVGVREGILLDLLAGGGTLCGYPDRALEEACLRLGNRHGHDEAHARQVARLGDRLFLDLAPLHGLGDEARRLLAAAALLHDLGVSVGVEDHHKHSLTLILQSELPGIPPDGLQVVANVARYHRKGLPATDHEAFARLDDGRRAVVCRLAALLRIADALDRRHASVVTSLSATVHEHEVEIAVEAAGDLAEERWSLDRKADLFTELYGRRVVLAGGGSGP